MPTVTIDGSPIAYTDTGAPTGRPDAPAVVFGHGLLFGGWMFRAQIEALRHDYRCVTIDWRGQGETPPTATGYDMDTLTGDARGVIESLGLGPVHWVGLSMGGFVGQRLAARHGDLLRSLTLLDTSADAERSDKGGEYKTMAWVLRHFGLRPIKSRVARHLFGPHFLATATGRATVDEWATRLRALDHAAIRRALFGVADRAPTAHEIPAITVPTLVVVGADDRATPPAESHRLAALIPGAELHTLPACGHSSSLEQPDAITELLRQFLDRVDRTAPDVRSSRPVHG
ncbi:alpha/beta fold hydrolase [Nocardia sp. alder85J]|uniref:alpha/beta fold hydrolase n=1 Tax=Nocardia sp. alder85J TaxID=2862949 RepID=UPI001CD49FD7|nr:alpha/beta fold hydrolase [Nocardia sp. alder85J]MCX4091563.1 alpha/beta fold hydrolase [Nocardia sp. alder85J]